MVRLDAVRKDLQGLAGHEVLLYGSSAAGTATARSDRDVAVITRDPDPRTNRATWRRLLGSVPDGYDLRVFELLPLHVQAGAMRHYEVVWGDPVEISAYLYPYRRRWKDTAHRIRDNPPLPVRERVQRLAGR